MDVKKTITVKDIRKLMEYAEAHQVPPGVITTKEEARRMNRIEFLYHEVFGIAMNKWKVGDKYYSFPLSKKITDTLGIK